MSVDGKGRPTVAEKPPVVVGIEREDRRGLRQAVAFEDVPAGQRLPLRRGGRQHRGAATDRDAQPAEIHLADLGMHQQSAVERVHAGQGRGARLFQDRDEAVHVARIGDQPVLRADREVGDEVHHQREDVIERQRGDHDLLAGPHGSAMNALNCSVLATRLRCESAAPFERPVVPPVYCRNSRSSPHSATGVKAELRALRQRIGEGDHVGEPRVHRRTGQGRAGAVAERRR